MKILLFTTVLFSGLVAGLFYSYSCSVNPGLRSLSDADYIKAMQGINIAIQNPAFFASFMGLMVLYPVSAYQVHQTDNPLAFYLLTISLALYYIGVFGITAFFNVPLNEQLAAFPIVSATSNEITAMRNAFENPWNTFHSLRTVASIISFGLLIAALMIKDHAHEAI